MYQYFVYLILLENRLIILDHPIHNEKYYLLMSNNGGNKEMLLAICKTFCLGYLYGGEYGKKLNNSAFEFKC